MMASALYTLLPLAVANVAHMLLVKGNHLASLALPIDGGCCFRGTRVFGDHKTWRGLIWIVTSTMLLVGLQYAVQRRFPVLEAWNLVAMEYYPWWQVGCVWGLGYALAELPNSFFKRRLRISPGNRRKGWPGGVQVLIDQADSAIGCGLAGWLFLGLDTEAWLWIIAVGTLLHLGLNLALGLVRVRTRPV